MECPPHPFSRYVFDNLSCEQAEDLLRQHGAHGTYLVAHFHDPESFGLSIRLRYVFHLLVSILLVAIGVT